MKRRGFGLVAAAVALTFLPLTLPRAIGAPQALKTPSLSESHDLSGVWFTHGKVRANFAFQEGSPLLPWGEDRLKANQQKMSPVLNVSLRVYREYGRSPIRSRSFRSRDGC